MESQRNSDLKPFFEPRSVAILGSLRDQWGEGFKAIRNMQTFGFAGSIYPVNPSYDEVLGLKAYASVDDVQDDIDLVIVVTPPPTVAGILQQCALKGTRAAIVVTENFAEIGGDGARLQDEMAEVARSCGIRVIGPNTIGVVNTSNGLVTNPYHIDYDSINKGGIAYASQSGFVGAQGQPLQDRGYPISKMCDFGNKCDVDEADLLDYLADDPDTRVIAMHMEVVKDGRRLMAALRDITPRKPVVIFKTGRTEEGARASASHTGSLASGGNVYHHAFKQAGALLVDTWQEYWEVPKVFALQSLPRGNRVAVLTPTGGIGVASVDAAVKAGLTVARFSDATLEKLRELAISRARNPIDLGPTMVMVEDPYSVMKAAMGAALSDPNVDCGIMVLFAGSQGPVADTVEMVRWATEQGRKPVAVWIYGTSASARDETARQVEKLGVPAYVELETAIKALGIAAGYARMKADSGRAAS